jgi:hypothetical protein
VQVCTYDWVHTFLQGGVFNTEAEAVLKVAGDQGLLHRRDVQRFLKDGDWRWPRKAAEKNRYLHRIFDERRGDADKIKCSCAEALGVYGMIRLTDVFAAGCSTSNVHTHRGCVVCFSRFESNTCPAHVRRFMFETRLGTNPEVAKNVESFRAMCSCLDFASDGVDVFGQPSPNASPDVAIHNNHV